MSISACADKLNMEVEDAKDSDLTSHPFLYTCSCSEAKLQHNYNL